MSEAQDIDVLILGGEAMHPGSRALNHAAVPELYTALNGHMICFGTGDGRVNLVYPFMGRVLIGSTDIEIDDPDAAVCDRQETDYLRGVVAEIFPDLPVTETQIRSRFSGVRPLPRADGDVAEVTRDHSIAELSLPSGTPVLCLIGGKWTTFRGFSEQAADRVLDLLGHARRRGTAQMQIGGGKGYPAPFERASWIARRSSETGVPEPRIELLLSRYGTRAASIAAELGADEPLGSLPTYSREELLWLIDNERVGSVDDLLRRRTDIAISGSLSEAVREEVSSLFEVGRSAVA